MSSVEAVANVALHFPIVDVQTQGNAKHAAVCRTTRSHSANSLRATRLTRTINRHLHVLLAYLHAGL
jgi:hypothetical protein